MLAQLSELLICFLRWYPKVHKSVYMVQFVTVYFDVEDQLSFADNPYLLDVILTPKSLLALHTLSATRASRSSGEW